MEKILIKMLEKEEEMVLNGSLNFFVGQVANAGIIKTVSRSGNPLDIAIVSFVGSDDSLSAMQNQAGFDEYKCLSDGDIVAFTHGGVDVVEQQTADTGEVLVRGRRNFKNVIPVYGFWKDGKAEKPSFLEGRKPKTLVDKRGDTGTSDTDESTGGMFGQ